MKINTINGGKRMSKKQAKTENCPVCGNEMVRLGKAFNFTVMAVVCLIIWPMILFLPFVGFLPVKHTCKTCKKTYKQKELVS
jgi:Zn finger protein HypA/HybF involved in hydrogenase expression